MYILGLSAYYHDSAAALIKDGHIVAAKKSDLLAKNMIPVSQIMLLNTAWKKKASKWPT